MRKITEMERAYYRRLWMRAERVSTPDGEVQRIIRELRRRACETYRARTISALLGWNRLEVREKESREVDRLRAENARMQGEIAMLLGHIREMEAVREQNPYDHRPLLSAWNVYDSIPKNDPFLDWNRGRMREANRARSRLADERAKVARKAIEEVLREPELWHRRPVASLRDIATALNARKLPSPYGNTWSHVQVRRAFERTGGYRPNTPTTTPIEGPRPTAGDGPSSRWRSG